MIQTPSTSPLDGCSPVRTAGIFFVLAFLLWLAHSARGDAPPPELYTITPSNPTIRAGTPLSVVYQFYNPSDNRYPYTDNVTVAPIPKTDFYGPQGAAAGESAELAEFPGYQASIGPGQYGQFTLDFTTGFDDGNSASWQFSTPPISYTWSVPTIGDMYPSAFGTPTVTLYETPEPSTLGLLGVAILCLLARARRKWRTSG
jgi:hypothetical protein